LAVLSVKTIASRCLGRTAPLSIGQDVLGLFPPTRSLRQHLELIYTQQCCDIRWQPSVLAPVFYGIQDFGLSDGAPVALRVFYPSIDGAPHDAPFLVGCGVYPLVVFLHGHCDEANHYLKWELLPAQLARSGYVVVVPEIQPIAPWEGSGLAESENVLAWMRSKWEHRLHLRPPPSTGIAGHSYGALLGARLATRVAASAYVSLGAGWAEWPTGASAPPRPLGTLNAPALFAWGSNDTFADLGSDGFWGEVAPPKHQLVFAGAGHWDYLPANSTMCEGRGIGGVRGPCDLIQNLAADLAATFLSKHMPPQRWPELRHDIGDDLIPPPHALTEEQQFFAGNHLMGLSLICDTSVCSATLRWEALGPSQGSLTLPQDLPQHIC
jgi:Chlorophyllase enzyme